jgi:hypothetical protein
MTSLAIIRNAQNDGVKLSLSPLGTIKATGGQEAMTRWLPTIREHKAEIIDTLEAFEERAAIYEHEAGFSREEAERMAIAGVTGGAPATPMTAKDETAIRVWLARIEETDPQNIADTLALCQRDQEARACFLRRAGESKGEK